jgi:hypothetical protein
MRSSKSERSDRRVPIEAEPTQTNPRHERIIRERFPLPAEREAVRNPQTKVWETTDDKNN